MDVRVRLSAGLAPAIGTPRLVVSLAENSTVADLLSYLRQQYPALTPQMDTAIPMVAGRYAALTDLLRAGQEVALLMPAAGGSS